MILSSFNRFIVVFLICVPLIFLFFRPLKVSQYDPGSDEGYYYRYALFVEKHGAAGFDQMLAWYSSSEEAQLHPSPMRAGYILWLVFLFKIFGPSYAVLGASSFLCFILFLLVCFYYGRKYFGLDAALLFVLLLSSSPLLLGLGRRGLSDSPMNLLWALCAWMFLDFLMAPRKGKYVCIILLLALTLTVKESILIPMLFFAWVGIWFKQTGSAIRWSDIAGTVVWPLCIVFIFYCLILGGLPALHSALNALMKAYFGPNHANLYAVYFDSGPWFRYVLDFLLLNPVATLLAIAYAGYLAARRDLLTRPISYFLLYFGFVYAFFSAFPHRKIVRFVVNLEMVLALFAVLMLIELFKPQESRKRQRIFILALIGLAVINWRGFFQLFYMPGMIDPVSYNLLVLRDFVPHH